MALDEDAWALDGAMSFLNNAQVRNPARSNTTILCSVALCATGDVRDGVNSAGLNHVDGVAAFIVEVLDCSGAGARAVVTHNVDRTVPEWVHLIVEANRSWLVP